MTRGVSLNNLPSVLAIFPLEGALLLPRARLPLNIFEPRYLAMLDDALKSEHRMIGMVQPRERGGSGAPPVYEIGCAGRVTSFSETEDGRYLIALTGALRFRIRSEVEGFTPFRRIEPDWSPFESDLSEPDEEDFPHDRREIFLRILKRYFAAADLNADWDALSQADGETLINAIAMLCPFSPQEKQALLEATTLREREESLRALMEFVVAEPESGVGGAGLQ
ncbi:MAG: LON peptidase substrate-binding domain-containing protein [Pseudomonadota bacterium]